MWAVRNLSLAIKSAGEKLSESRVRAVRLRVARTPAKDRLRAVYWREKH